MRKENRGFKERGNCNRGGKSRDESESGLRKKDASWGQKRRAVGKGRKRGNCERLPS